MTNEPNPTPLTTEELRELERLEREATRDWSEAARDNDGRIFDGRGRLIFMSVGQTVSESEHVSNLVLAVALRNASPRILSELAALREENARLSEEVIARVAQVADLTAENERLRAWFNWRKHLTTRKQYGLAFREPEICEPDSKPIRVRLVGSLTSEERELGRPVLAWWEAAIRGIHAPAQEAREG